MHLQAHCSELQVELREAAQRLTTASREAERAAVQGEAEQQSRDAAALQARVQEVAAVREHADRCQSHLSHAHDPEREKGLATLLIIGELLCAPNSVP